MKAARSMESSVGEAGLAITRGGMWSSCCFIVPSNPNIPCIPNVRSWYSIIPSVFKKFLNTLVFGPRVMYSKNDIVDIGSQIVKATAW